MRLKPCPFCGGKADFGETETLGVFVECSKCKACSVMMYPDKCDARPIVAERWNKRVVDRDTNYHADYYDLDSRQRKSGGEHELLEEALAAVKMYEDWTVRDDNGYIVASHARGRSL